MSWLDRLASKSIPPTRVACIAYYIFVVAVCGLFGLTRLVMPTTVLIIDVVLVLFGWPVLNIIYMLIKKRVRNTKKAD